MADDITLVIGVQDKGIVEAQRRVAALEANIRTLSKGFANGTISVQQYNRGLLETKREYERFSTSTQKATSDIRRFAQAQIEARRATEQASNLRSLLSEEQRRMRLMERSSKMAADSARAEARARKELERIVRQETQALEERQRAAQAGINSRLGVSAPVSGGAQASAAVIERELQKQEAAVERLQQEYRQLAASVDPVERAQLQLANATRILDNALKQNIITADQHAARMAQVRQQMVATGVAFNQFGAVSSVSGKNFNRFNMQLQQVGYQVGDFAVQVQSGTSAFVAFGQQATQLLGVFGAGGAIAGAVLAISTALARPLYDAWAAANDTTDAFKGLKSAGDALTSVGRVIDDLDMSFRDANKEAYNFLQILRQIREDAFQSSVTGAVGSLGFSDFFEQFEAIQESGQAFGGGVISALLGQMDTMTNEGLRNMQEMEQFMGLTYDEAVRVDSILKTIGGSTTKELAQSFAEAFTQIDEAGLLTDDLKAALDRIESELGLADLIREANDEFANSNSLTSQLERNIRAAADALTDLANQAAGVSISNIGRQAQLSVLQGGGSTTEAASAARIAEARARITPTVFDEGGAAQQELQNLIAAEQEAVRLEESIQAVLDARRPARSGGGGGRAQQVRDLRAEFENLMGTLDPVYAATQQYFEQETLLNEALSAGKINATEYASALGLITEQFQQATAGPIQQYIAELERLQDFDATIAEGAKSLQSAFADFLFNPFESGVQGMVLQFADAIRRMMAEAIAARAVNALLGAFGLGAPSAIPGISVGGAGFYAKGGAFSNGNVIPFANGGVVNGPTIFPMAKGMGLMGEAGPEAIMPLTRGADGKLGVKSNGSQQQGGTSVAVVIVDDERDAERYKNDPRYQQVEVKRLKKLGVAFNG